jgi:REP-associated tyrosine transposase
VPQKGAGINPAPTVYYDAQIGMPYNSQTHHRRSIRKRGYDYSHPGWYFITLSTEGKQHAFGAVIEWRMELSEPGRMVGRFWKSMPQRFPGISLDEFIVMPNHFHAIFQIRARHVGAPLVGAHSGTKPHPSVGAIVGAFKSLTASEYLRNAQVSGWKNLPEGLWQRNFYERIIRHNRELEDIRGYIRENPAQWDTDPEFS